MPVSFVGIGEIVKELGIELGHGLHDIVHQSNNSPVELRGKRKRQDRGRQREKGIKGREQKR